jgi:WD40 repeat protein
METLTTFQPPHMDTVTGLAISKGYLISGSKDKNLRLWSLDNSIYNLKSTIHAFNDYITTVESTSSQNIGDNYHPLFYSADRTGQVKVGTIIKERIEFIGIISHAQSVNSVCSLEINKGITATGSSDKTIKLWQPNNETFHQLENNF